MYTYLRIMGYISLVVNTLFNMPSTLVCGINENSPLWNYKFAIWLVRFIFIKILKIEKPLMNTPWKRLSLNFVADQFPKRELRCEKHWLQWFTKTRSTCNNKNWFYFQMWEEIELSIGNSETWTKMYIFYDKIIPKVTFC